MSTVLQENIVSMFPDVPLPYRPLVHCVVKPLRQDKRLPPYLKPDHETPIVILWTRDGTVDNQPGAVYTPNHIVPLLCKFPKRDKRQGNKRNMTVSSDIPKKQGRISDFFVRASSKSSKDQIPQSPCVEKPNSDSEVNVPRETPTKKPTRISGNSDDDDFGNQAVSGVPVCATKHSASESKSGKTTEARKSSLIYWLAQFQWLECEDNVLKCKKCVAAKKDNILTKGKLSYNTKKK